MSKKEVKPTKGSVPAKKINDDEFENPVLKDGTVINDEGTDKDEADESEDKKDKKGKKDKKDGKDTKEKPRKKIVKSIASEIDERFLVNGYSEEFVDSINRRVIAIPMDWRLAISPLVEGIVIGKKDGDEIPPASYRYGERSEDSKDKSQLLNVSYKIITDRLIDSFTNASEFVTEFDDFCWSIIMNSDEAVYAHDTIEINKTKIGKNPFFSQNFWAGRYSFKSVLLARITVNSVYINYLILLNSKYAFFFFLLQQFANIECDKIDSFVYTIPLLQPNLKEDGTYKASTDEGAPIWIDLDSDDYDKDYPCLANPAIFSKLTIPTDLKSDEVKLLANNINTLNDYIQELKTYEGRSQTGLAEGTENETLTNIYTCLRDDISEHEYTSNAIRKISKRKAQVYSSVNRGKNIKNNLLDSNGLANWFKKSPYDRGGLFTVTRSYVSRIELKMQIKIKGYKIVFASTSSGTDGIVGTSYINYDIVKEFFNSSLTGKGIYTVGQLPTEKYNADLSDNDYRANKIEFKYEGDMSIFNDSSLTPHYRINLPVPKVRILDGIFSNPFKRTYIDSGLKEYKHQYFDLSNEEDKKEDMFFDIELPFYAMDFACMVLRDLKVGDCHLPLYTDEEVYTNQAYELGINKKDQFEPYNEAEIALLRDMDNNRIKDLSGLANRLGILSSSLTQFINSAISYYIFAIIGTPEIEELVLKTINKNIDSFKDRVFSRNSVMIDNTFGVSVQSKENRIAEEAKAAVVKDELQINVKAINPSPSVVKKEVKSEEKEEDSTSEESIESSNEKD